MFQTSQRTEMRCLITGGAGFVGSNLAASLISEGHCVSVIDNLQREGTAKNIQWLASIGKYEFQQNDIRNRGFCDELIQSFKPDVIFHLAGQVAMTTSLKDPRDDYETNVTGTINILEIVRKKLPECVFAFASTNKVYGDLSQISTSEQDTRFVPDTNLRAFDEYLPLNFKSPYGCSKGAADQYVLEYARAYGLRTFVFRHSTIYGGKQLSSYDQGWIGWFASEAVAQLYDPTKSFSISGSGKQVRDILHVNDVISLYKCLLEKKQHAYGEAFNIGGGLENSISIIELVDLLETKLDHKLNTYHISERHCDQRYYVSQINKAVTAFNWKPTISISSGIDEVLSKVKNT